MKSELVPEAKGKVELFGLVRDKNGKPKFDNSNEHIPEPIWDMLTDTEKQEIIDGRNTHSSN